VPTQAWRVTVVGFLTRPIWARPVRLVGAPALADGVFTPAPQAGAPRARRAPPAPPRRCSRPGYYFSVRPGTDVTRGAARRRPGCWCGTSSRPCSVADQQAQSHQARWWTLLQPADGLPWLWGLVVGNRRTGA